MANYILVMQVDVPEEHDAEFNRLYDDDHVSSRWVVPASVAPSANRSQRAAIW